MAGRSGGVEDDGEDRQGAGGAGDGLPRTPDYDLFLDEAPRLALSADAPVNCSRPAIDVLFESAADLCRERPPGMIPTGGNQDGAAGLAAVQRGGGVTVVQEPQGAQVALMPASALQRIVPDHVLPLGGIADLLRGLARPAA